MANLALLPVELLNMIANEIHRMEKSTTHLASLSLTCRHFHCVFEPALYRNIRYENVEHYKSNPLPLFLLVRTILHRNDLAAHIQSIYLRGWSRNRIDAQLIKAKYTKKESRILRNQKFFAGHDLQNEWLLSSTLGKADFFLTILLSRCENLTVLDLDWHPDVRKSLAVSALTLTIRTATRWQFPCPDLKFINYAAERLADDEVDAFDRGGIDINHVAHLFHAYSLLQISVSNISTYPLTHHLPSFDRPIALTRLILQGVGCSESDLEMLLSVENRLEELVWDRVCKTSGMHNRTFDCNTLERALFHVKDTLVSLKVSLGIIDFPFRGFECDMRGRVKSLHAHTRLETLNIPAAVLMGWSATNILALEDQLPKSLIKLTLSDDSFEQKPNKLGIEIPLKCLTEYILCTKHTARNLRCLELQTRNEEWVNAAEKFTLSWLALQMGLHFSIMKLAKITEPVRTITELLSSTSESDGFDIDMSEG